MGRGKERGEVTVEKDIEKMMEELLTNDTSLRDEILVAQSLKKKIKNSRVPFLAPVQI